MEFSASQIAELLNGTVEGDSEITVNKLSKIENKQELENEIKSFVAAEKRS